MKVHLLAVILFSLAVSARAQTSEGAYTPEQLDQLVGPIALYPDPLLALILPASTVPSDITLAAGYLAANGPAGGIDAQPWDSSVKALAHYPTVITWMNANLNWTQALGAAFTRQPSDVMKSVQQLRVRARAAGTLVDTPQQRVVFDGEDIRIVPAQTDTVYVPEYDPSDVYDVPGDNGAQFVTFGDGYPAGAWLDYQCDWDDYGIWVGPWMPGWGYDHGWRTDNRGQAWRHDSQGFRGAIDESYRSGGRLPTPSVIAGYHGSIRQPSPAPRLSFYIPQAAPDYRGRTDGDFRPSGQAAPSQLLGGYSRGTRTRASSNRGQLSRSAPVRGRSSQSGGSGSRGNPYTR